MRKVQLKSTRLPLTGLAMRLQEPLAVDKGDYIIIDDNNDTIAVASSEEFSDAYQVKVKKRRKQRKHFTEEDRVILRILQEANSPIKVKDIIDKMGGNPLHHEVNTRLQFLEKRNLTHRASKESGMRGAVSWQITAEGKRHNLNAKAE